MSSCVGLVYFQSLLLTWTKTTASGLSYELGVNGEKKMEIEINGHSTFYHTGKPGNFNILREIILITLWHSYFEIDWR